MANNKRNKKELSLLLLEALKQYEFYLDRFYFFVIGDFNCYIGQPNVKKSTGTFEDSVNFLEGHGLRSIYHEMTGEKFGKESKSTIFHLFKEDAPSSSTMLLVASNLLIFI